MKYNFTTIENRNKKTSAKWNKMYNLNSNIPENIIPLSVADMEFKQPPELTKGLIQFTENAIFGYTVPDENYYNSVINWMKNRHNFTVEKDWIVTTSGVVSALFGAVKAFSEENEGVIVMSPVYYPFYRAIEETGRKIVKSPLVNTNDYYSIDYEKLEELCKDENNKLIIFCSPHNPIGRVWKKEELEKLSSIVIKYDKIIISDEIHNDLIMKGYKHTVLQTISEEISNRTITCTAPSKTFNTAGLACSNIIIKNNLLRDKFLNAILKSGSGSVNSYGYEGCKIVYNKCSNWLDELLNIIEINRDLVVKFFKEKYPKITVMPLEGTYLQWINFKALDLNKDELERFMYEKAYFFTDEGYIFGEEGEGYERINLAVPTKQLEICLNYLDDALKEIY